MQRQENPLISKKHGHFSTQKNPDALHRDFFSIFLYKILKYPTSYR